VTFYPAADATVVSGETTTVDFDLVSFEAIEGAINDIGEAICEEGAVYVFEGTGVTPDDVDGISPDPIASATPFVDIPERRMPVQGAFTCPRWLHRRLYLERRP